MLNIKESIVNRKGAGDIIIIVICSNIKRKKMTAFKMHRSKAEIIILKLKRRVERCVSLKSEQRRGKDH
jgi:hypothetical protein